MTKRKTIISLAIGSTILLAGLAANVFWGKIIGLDGQIFIAETPLSDAAYEKGLGGRQRLCQHCAMLFRFSQKGEYAFWMHGMNFDLDILWIADGKIVYIKKDFSKDSAVIVTPIAPADSVLEIGAGMSDKYNFKIGDKVHIY